MKAAVRGVLNALGGACRYQRYDGDAFFRLSWTHAMLDADAASAIQNARKRMTDSER